MPKNKKSFFERLAGNSSIDEEEEMEDNDEKETKAIKEPSWLEDEESGQLTIDMFQTPTEIVIEAMIAGVKPEDIDVSVNKDMLTINGKRQKSKETSE